MRNVFIYALCEPGTRTVRYIGKTVNLKNRFKAHVKTSSKEESHLGNWLRSLAGVLPSMVTLREVSEVDGSAAEIKYIRIARESLGMNLVNATDGGEGTSGWIPSTETRAAIGAAAKARGSHTPEHRAKIRAGMLGKNRGPHTSEHRAKNSAARRGVKRAPRTPEHRAALRAAMMGREITPGARAKISAALRGKPWSEARRAAYEKKKAS